MTKQEMTAEQIWDMAVKATLGQVETALNLASGAALVSGEGDIAGTMTAMFVQRLAKHIKDIPLARCPKNIKLKSYSFTFVEGEA
jgi:hypothetical protein